MDLASCDRVISRYQKQTMPKNDFFFFLILLPKICSHSNEGVWATDVNQGQCSKWTIKRTPGKLWLVSGHEKNCSQRSCDHGWCCFTSPCRQPGSTQARPEDVYRLIVCTVSFSWRILQPEHTAVGAATKIRTAKRGKAGKQLVKLWRCAHRSKEKLEILVNGLHLKTFSSKNVLRQEFLALEIKRWIVI